MKIDIITLIIFTSAAIEFILGAIVFFGDRKNKINQLFFTVAIITGYWIITNPLMALSPSDFWVRHSYAVGILVAPVILVWINFFISKRRNYYFEFFFVLLPSVFFFAVTSFSDLVIKDVQSNFVGGFDGTFGVLFPLFAVYFIVISSNILYSITKVYVKNRGLERTQYGYIAFGLYGFGVVTTIVSFFLPLVGIDTLIPLDSPSSIFFVVAMSFAILKHQLFNIKVIATELLVFLLWIIILIRVVIADTLSESLVNGGLLTLTVVVGIFLIKSVIREVSQREKIELLAGDLQKANDRLRELDRQKSEFVSFATHQLRAPLTAMKGYASLILEGDLGKLSNDLRGAITRIYDSSNTLANIVDDYLNISRIELGSMRYTFEPVDLKDLLDNEVGELKPNIEKSKLCVNFHIDKTEKYMVSADKDKFKQIIANLVDNALKYTPAGCIDISLIKIGKGTERKIQFSVKDNGIGIAPEVMPKLFAKFSRAENGTRQNIHGTGLGLFVAKQIIDAHHGKIWAESMGEGKGSTFFVELEEVI
jgi:signal transduction histidine kinase